MCLDGVADKHNLFKSYFSPPFKLLNQKVFHTFLSGSTTLEKLIDWSSPSQHKSKNFHLKIACLMGKKGGGKLFLNRKKACILYFSLMLDFVSRTVHYIFILSLCKPWNHEINYVYLPPRTSSSVAVGPLISAGITSNIPNLCPDVKQPLLLLVEKKEIPQKMFPSFPPKIYFLHMWFGNDSSAWGLSLTWMGSRFMVFLRSSNLGNKRTNWNRCLVKI